MVKKVIILLSLTATLANLQIHCESGETHLAGAAIFLSAIAATKGMQYYYSQLEKENRNKRLDSISETIQNEAAKKIKRMPLKDNNLRISNDDDRSNSISLFVQTKKFEHPFSGRFQPNNFGYSPHESAITKAYKEKIIGLTRQLEDANDNLNFAQTALHRIQKKAETLDQAVQNYCQTHGYNVTDDSTEKSIDNNAAITLQKIIRGHQTRRKIKMNATDYEHNNHIIPEITASVQNRISSPESYTTDESKESIDETWEDISFETQIEAEPSLQPQTILLAEIRSHINYEHNTQPNHTGAHNIRQEIQAYIDDSRNPQNNIQPNIAESAQQKNHILLYYLHGSQIGNNQQNLANEYNDEIERIKPKLGGPVITYNTFPWSGKLHYNDRNAAGKNFAFKVKDEINNVLENNPTLTKNAISIVTVSHSHGGNVIYHAGEELKKHNIPIDTAIMFGCPNPDFNRDNYNIKTVLNIMGAEDFTGRAGSALQSRDIWQALFTGKSSSVSTSLQKNHKQAVNITLKIHGEDLGHKDTVANGIELIPHIIEYINTTYPNAKHLILNAFNRSRNSQPDWQIMGCIDNEFHDDHLTPEMIATSQTNAALYQRQYGKSIYEKPSLEQAFTKEFSCHAPQRVVTMGRYIANRIENISNPQKQKMDKFLTQIENERNFEKKALLFAQFKATIFQEMQEMKDEDSQEIFTAYEKNPRIHAIQRELNAWSAKSSENNNSRNSNHSSSSSSQTTPADRTPSPESSQYITPPSSPNNAKIDENKDLGSSWSSEDFS